MQNVISNDFFDNFVKQNNLADQSLIAFLKDTNYGTKDLANYQKYLKDTGKATSTFSSALNKAKGVLKGFGAALGSMAANWAIGVAIEAAINLADKLTESLEEQKEKLEETKNKISNYESQISELEGKLSENNRKIQEINSHPLSIVDKNTLSTLEKENTQLKQQLDMVESLNETAKDLASNTTLQILNNTAEITGLIKSIEAFKKGDILGGIKGSDNSFGGIINAFDKFKEGDIAGGIDTGLRGLLSNGLNPIAIMYNWFAPQKENEYSPTEEARNQIEEIKSLYDEYNKTSDIDDKNKIQSDITDKTTALLTNIKTLQSYKATLDAADPEQSKWIAEIQKVEDAYLSMQTKKEDFNTFDEIINSDIYSKDKEKLIELASQGKLTSKAIEENYHNLFVLFRAIGLSADDVIYKLKQMGVEEQRASSTTPSSNDSSIYSDKYNNKKQHLIELEQKLRYLKAKKTFSRDDSLKGIPIYKMPFELNLSKEELNQQIAEIEKQIPKAKKQLQNQLDKESGTVILNAWNLLGKNETDEETKSRLLESKDKVLELAEAGKLTVKAFKNSEAGKTILDQTKLSAEEATKVVNELADSSKQLSVLKSGISSIRDAYREKKEEKQVGADTFVGMENTFGGLGKSWENYKATLGTSSSTLAILCN